MTYNPSIVSAFFVESGLPAPVFEHVYIPGRRFRLDVAWPEHKVGIEVQGGIWMKAAHSTGAGIRRDMQKNNLGLLAGWLVLQVEPKDLCLTETAKMVEQLFQMQ